MASTQGAHCGRPFNTTQIHKAIATMFQIKQLAIKQTADIPVKTADGKPVKDEAGNPLSVTMYGPASKQFQEAKHQAEQRAAERNMAKYQGTPLDPITAEQKAKERAEFLADCTVSFNNFGNGDLRGHDLYMSVYTDAEIGHIADDCEKGFADRKNFLPVPANSSPSTSVTVPG